MSAIEKRRAIEAQIKELTKERQKLLREERPRKSRLVQFRIESEAYEQLEALAKEHGVSLGLFARWILMSLVSGEKTKSKRRARGE